MSIANRNEGISGNANGLLYILGCCVFCGLYFVRDIIGLHVNYYFIYFVAFVIVFIMETKYSVAFVMSLSAFTKAGFSGIFCIMMLIAFLAKLFRNKIRCNKPFAILTFLILYELSHYVFGFLTNQTEVVSYCSMIMVLALILQIDKERLDMQLIVKSFIAFSLFFVAMAFLETLQAYNYSIVQLLTNGLRTDEYKLLYSSSTEDRLIGNQNFLSSLSAVNISICSFMYLHDKKKLSYIAMIGAFCVIGLLTISKMFMVTMLAFAILFVISQWRNKARYGVISLVIIFLVGLGFYYYFKNTLVALVVRRFEIGMLTGDITTGRTGIIQGLIHYLNNNPLRYVFGVGLLNLQYALQRAVHNSVFELLGGWGLIGMFVAVHFIVTLIKDARLYRNANKIGVNYLCYLPLVIGLIYSLAGMLFSSWGGIARLIVYYYIMHLGRGRYEV